MRDCVPRKPERTVTDMRFFVFEEEESMFFVLFLRVGIFDWPSKKVIFL